MKLLHLFLVVIIAEEVFSGEGNSCSSPPLPFSPKSTGNQKKINEIIASVNVVNQILFTVLDSIFDQIAIETASSADYLSGVITQQIDPADYPISCIAEALIQMYQFVFSTYGTIVDTAIAAKASLEAMP
ncbi:CLUMA_CG007092, isoform A [Clunio marinus]|uniref:CLUMA_CG007092, isoform A n=1 Tax=Clunio marinus TaxID=568069 RepID=A0A1J1HZM5_9DIPT|nr:CLUMA_CG007092, isoform A [Clunio marinus]